MLQKPFSPVSFLLGLWLVVVQAVFVAGSCCPSSYGICRDESAGYCCGIGACNVFCCNCDGGAQCRGDAPLGHQTHFEIEPEEDDCLAHFASADDNGDGKLSFLEFITDSTAGEDVAAAAVRWALFDVESNGYLTLQEALYRRG